MYFLYNKYSYILFLKAFNQNNYNLKSIIIIKLKFESN